MNTPQFALSRSFDNSATAPPNGFVRPLKTEPSSLSDAARVRLLALPREPFLKVKWEPVLFLNFQIAADVLKPFVPTGFELELHDDLACLSLAVVHMSGFRSGRLCSRGMIFQALGQQRFLNFRTYVKHGGERGVLFLHGWLSRPSLLPVPSRLLGLPYRFARFDSRHESDSIAGKVDGGGSRGSLDYRVRIPANTVPAACPRASTSEFAMEQYTGFFVRRGHGYVFRVWHPPWRQAPVEAQLSDISLVTNLFPWFGRATFSGAHLTEAIDGVWLSRAYRLPAARPKSGNHRVLSGFYDMP
jgi:uncharacterized protein